MKIENETGRRGKRKSNGGGENNQPGEENQSWRSKRRRRNSASAESGWHLSGKNHQRHRAANHLAQPKAGAGSAWQSRGSIWRISLKKCLANQRRRKCNQAKMRNVMRDISWRKLAQRKWRNEKIAINGGGVMALAMAKIGEMA